LLSKERSKRLFMARQTPGPANNNNNNNNKIIRSLRPGRLQLRSTKCRKSGHKLSFTQIPAKAAHKCQNTIHRAVKCIPTTPHGRRRRAEAPAPGDPRLRSLVEKRKIPCASVADEASSAGPPHHWFLRSRGASDKPVVKQRDKGEKGKKGKEEEKEEEKSHSCW